MGRLFVAGSWPSRRHDMGLGDMGINRWVAALRVLILVYVAYIAALLLVILIVAVRR